MTPAKVFVVLASRSDAVATTFVAAAADRGMRLMTPADLSEPGWNLHVDGATDSIAVVSGQPVAASAIAGVMTRLPVVSADDLPHIVPADRTYVAAEMSAFLLAWLMTLRCPLLNRPSEQWLSGPMWRSEKWVLTAGRLGIPTRSVTRRLPAPETAAVETSEPAGTTITIIGGKHVGAADQVLAKRARALAKAAGVDLLAVRFDGSGPDANFVEASLWPDLDDRRIAQAVIALLRKAAGGNIRRRTPHDFAVGNFAG